MCSLGLPAVYLNSYDSVELAKAEATANGIAFSLSRDSSLADRSLLDQSCDNGRLVLLMYLVIGVRSQSLRASASRAFPTFTPDHPPPHAKAIHSSRVALVRLN